ncbi:Putative acyl-CoA-binding protein, ACBP [Septoria linicola]|uniref:Acyl-CoA-binding protein, ACBP n=1 Tax=Septoria linicola TaxID=215465 RepID=A0A9Q9ATZ5_9PEZI|nr:putative acyl-CoA-binding protein, ACBP [Septoria linicola]USW54729.1 Putative acyl-CoA-binding protein, ACBP [Septoria linicola]
MAPATQSAEFKKAVEDSRKLKAKPSNDQLLELYALFKVGTNETEFEKAEKPGVFDPKGKAKYNAWKKEADAGTKPEAAQKKYVELVEKLKNELGFEG